MKLRNTHQIIKTHNQTRLKIKKNLHLKIKDNQHDIANNFKEIYFCFCTRPLNLLKYDSHFLFE